MRAKLNVEGHQEVQALMQEIYDDHNGDPELVLVRLVFQRNEFRDLALRAASEQEISGIEKAK